MQQKMIVIGVSRIAGLSKKTGNSYDFVKVFTLDKLKTNDFVQQCEGYEVREWDGDAALLMQLRGVGFPIDCDCELEVGRENKLKIVRATPVKARSASTAS